MENNFVTYKLAWKRLRKKFCTKKPTKVKENKFTSVKLRMQTYIICLLRIKVQEFNKNRNVFCSGVHVFLKTFIVILHISLVVMFTYCSFNSCSWTIKIYILMSSNALQYPLSKYCTQYLCESD